MDGYNGDNKPAISASISRPFDVVTDSFRNVFVLENRSRIRRVDIQTGLITTAAGKSRAGYNGDDRSATSAKLADGWKTRDSWQLAVLEWT